jgi:hypothetical protein
MLQFKPIDMQHVDDHQVLKAESQQAYDSTSSIHYQAINCRLYTHLDLQGPQYQQPKEDNWYCAGDYVHKVIKTMKYVVVSSSVVIKQMDSRTFMV